MLKRLWGVCILIISVVLMTVMAHAQDGSGVIREGTTDFIDNTGRLNPLLCGNSTCERLFDMLFPRLLDVDSETGQFIPASENSYALATRWQQSIDSTVYTITLRDDLTWSDGIPVTAYDVLFTLGAVTDRDAGTRFYSRALSERIVGMAAPDAQTLVVQFAAPSCRALHNIDFPVIPAHPFDPEFAAFAAENTPTEANPLNQIGSWDQASENYDYSIIQNHPFGLDPITAGPYTLSEIRPTEYIRLVAANGKQAYEIVSVNSTLEAFLEGDLDYLNNFPYTRIPDLEAAGANMGGGVRTVVYGLAMNLADPTVPRDWDTDEEEGQGVHPIFGDIRVRQAVQLAISAGPIMDIAVLGNGTIASTPALPGSWYENTSLKQPAQDLNAARKLLSDAGWRDANGDRILECRGCLYAAETTPLIFSLTYASDDEFEALTAQALARQLALVGINVRLGGDEITGQRFDAALVSHSNGYPYDPVNTFRAFESDEDLVNAGANITSYSNPQVDRLLEQAETLGICDDFAMRAAFYKDAQALIAEDIPYIWLYAPHRIYAAAGTVQGFAPTGADPLWNIEEWIVTAQEVSR